VSETPFWLEEPAPELPRRAFAGRAEVAVIGGGVTGCSCALTLAERGVRVRLYEQRRIAGGASGRNGGFALRGAAAPYDVACDELGRRAARSVMTLTEQTLDRLERLAGDAFRRVGSLRLAADEAELAALHAEYGALRADGFAVEWVDTLEPPLDRLYLGAILQPPDGAIVPARWVRRLAGHAVDAGAEIVEEAHVAVEGVDADVVVVCGDGFTASLLPELADVVVATRGQVLATEPLPALRYPLPHYARGGYDYWHQQPDGRLVIGGQRDTALADEQTEVEAVNPAVQTSIDDLVEALVGHRPAVTHRWAGIWGATPDLLPLAGPLAGLLPGRENVWIAGGYSGHGNVLGLACGDLVARAILGDRPAELGPFAPARLFDATYSSRR